MTKNNLIILFTGLIIAAGLGFLGGRQYQKGKAIGARPNQFPNGNRSADSARVRNGLQGNRPFSGEVTKIEDKTITLKDEEGNSKIIIISDSTKINKTSEGTREDLSVGENIMIIGTEGADGTVTADSVSLGGNFMQRKAEQTPSQQP